LWELNRTEIGGFSLEQAIKLNQPLPKKIIEPKQVLEVINKDYSLALDFLRK